MNYASFRQAATVAVLTLGLGACSLAPHYVRPAAPIPRQWSDAAAAAQDDRAPSAAALQDWRGFVADPDLRRLIELALGNNRSLRQTLLDVEAARAQYRVQRADQQPAIALAADARRERVAAPRSASGVPEVQESYEVNLGLAAFELDLFGRLHNLSDAALQEFLATGAAAEAARIALVGEVIEAYLVRAGAQQRHRLTVETRQARATSLDLVSKRRQAGLSNALDQEEAQGLAAQSQADVERTEREFLQAGNALRLLVGVSDIGPQLEWKPTFGNAVVTDLEAAAPSSLVGTRPDIRAAEHRLRARNADIGAARAAFFPSIALTGSYGSASTQFSDLFGAGGKAWSFAPQIRLPIFQGGRNRANLDLATVRKDIAIAEYERMIQLAFSEVADALAAKQTLAREEDAVAAVARSNAAALVLSEARYRAGVDNHLRYLDAQRASYASQIASIEVATQRQIALARLFRALGGAWHGGTIDRAEPMASAPSVGVKR